jgi:hypothetical protein
MKALLTAAVVLIAVQPAFAQPRTPGEIAECVINEATYYWQRLNREFPERPNQIRIQGEPLRNPNDPLVAVATKAIADAVASKCAVK